MTLHELNISTNQQLWALEPAITPLPARGALVLGVFVGLLLWGVALGTAESSHPENWHGNVATSTVQANPVNLR